MDDLKNGQVEQRPDPEKQEHSKPSENWYLRYPSEDITPTLISDSRTCNHDFKHISGVQIKCTNCEWILVIGFGDKVIDGHLYHNDRKIV